MNSIFWHDYETFGADPQKDRPAQFAGVRTDLDLNIIEDPVTFYCRPSEDYLPAPEACLVTGITPQHAQREGLAETEFAERINSIFSAPGTCVAGYNSIRFDDEVSRNLFYRNFIDPYSREWKNGNSRWDIIDVMRMCHALRPESINWPQENGQTSFRLEKLTEANGITHESAHDAMSDVYATIELAKLLKLKQPKLYDYAYVHRDKNRLSELFDFNSKKPLLHFSSKYPASKGCCALVVPLLQHPGNKNGRIVWDLRLDPRLLFELDVEEIRRRLYSPSSLLAENETRPALKTIHVNKCPMIVNASSIKLIPEEARHEWELDLDKMNAHLTWLRSQTGLEDKLREVFSTTVSENEARDPDLMIYSGGFFSPHDRSQMEIIRTSGPEELAETEFQFQDSRLPEMLFRYRARNYPHSLSEEEQEAWSRHCYERLLGEGGEFLTFKQLADRINQIETSPSCTERDRTILFDLKLYAESIIPYC